MKILDPIGATTYATKNVVSMKLGMQLENNSFLNHALQGFLPKFDLVKKQGINSYETVSFHCYRWRCHA